MKDYYIKFTHWIKFSFSYLDGTKEFSIDYSVRSQGGNIFRKVALTCDSSKIIVPVTEKNFRDSVYVYNAANGTLASKIALKLPGFKVKFENSWDINLIVLY